MKRLYDGVACLRAPNPSLMTGPGTNTYLIGKGDVAVVDPGPVIDAHLDAICEAAGRIRWILVTHTHPDHSPGAAVLARRTGASLLGMRPPAGRHQDQTFAPDRELADGDRLETDAFTLTALHTPGHASNHLCFRHEASNSILTGDHIIDGSTVVINPPDGNMKAYLDGLARLRDEAPAALLPGHGEKIDDPRAVIEALIEHRLKREAKVIAALAAHPDSTAADLVTTVYAEVPEHLHGWAERSLLAHLEKLVEDERATERGGRFTLCGSSA